MDDRVGKRAAVYASVALLCFGALTALALVGWFHQSRVAFTWKSSLATACAVFALASSGLVWRTSSRVYVVLGLVVMLVSLVRIGPPSEWTWATFMLMAITALLLVPLVHAAIVSRDDGDDGAGAE